MDPGKKILNRTLVVNKVFVNTYILCIYVKSLHFHHVNVVLTPLNKNNIYFYN